MSSLLKTQVLGIIIALLLLLISGFSLAEVQDQPEKIDSFNLNQDDEHSSKVPSYLPVKFNMRENNRLSPELPEEGSVDSQVICPNGFSPNWWSLRGRFGSTEWRDVGTWETIRVGKALSATNQVVFRIWVTYLGEGTPGSSNFEFILLRNEDEIAKASRDVSLSSGMDPVLVDPTTHLINQTPFEEGDIFKLKIRCQISLDGAKILYGSMIHNSHVEMTCDPIDIYHITGDSHCVKGYYTDMFRVKTTRMGFICRVDKHDVLTPPQFGMETLHQQNLNIVYWEIPLEDGNHEVEIGISYIPNDNTSVVYLTENVEIKPKKVVTILGLELSIWILIIEIIILVAIIGTSIYIYRWRQDKKLFEEFEMDENLDYK
jgi:hypothetical protein